MNKNNLVKVDSSDELSKVSKKINIVGLEEVPSNIIPVPFYKVAYPGKVTLANGKEAEAGSFFMGDTGKTTDTLKFALLRAKRVKVEMEEGGKPQTRIQILGMNLEGFKPFIFSISVTSFSTLGRMIRQLLDNKAVVAWKYEITATTEKKINDKKQQYWVVNFEVGKELDNEKIMLLEDAYSEYAASLDWSREEEE